jgi:AcrR family transcriptional regulator
MNGSAARSADSTSGGTKTQPRGKMRAAQREFTRSRIVAAAIEVFAEKGYARTTVDDIAERAGATRATFYLHFKAKSDVLPELISRGEGHFHNIYRDLSPIAHDPTLASVRTWLSLAMAEWKAIADVSRPVAEAASIEPEINEILTARNRTQIAELADALRAGSPALSEADAEVYASILLAPLAYYFQLFLRGQPFNERRVLDAMASAWMAVITQAAETSQPARKPKSTR